ncbi:UNVERIFIED_CONTAM: hypothetical protein NCL1_43849 [Trichonephila clavipes]
MEFCFSRNLGESKIIHMISHYKISWNVISMYERIL